VEREPVQHRLRLGRRLHLQGLFIWLSIGVAIVSLRHGKWIPNVGAFLRVTVLGVFTVTTIIYAFNHGVSGFPIGDLKPTVAVFLALVPLLLFNYVGFELQSGAAEEMEYPRRDVPVAVVRSAITGVLLYAFMVVAVAAFSGATDSKFVVVLDIAISTTLISYLWIFPSAVKLRYAYGHVHRPYRVPYGRCGMWFAGGLTTLWVAVGSWVAVLPGTLEELFGLGYDFKDQGSAARPSRRSRWDARGHPAHRARGPTPSVRDVRERAVEIALETDATVPSRRRRPGHPVGAASPARKTGTP
jgi:amino acid transporter